MTRESASSGLTFLLTAAIVASVSAGARYLYEDSKATAAELQATITTEQVACQ